MHQLQQKHLQSKYQQEEEDVELQINITLKNVKYTLRVKNVSNLSQIVQKFITENNLNPKHHKTILNQLKRKLDQKQLQNHEKLIKLQKQNRLNQSLKKSCRRVSYDKSMPNINHNESRQSNDHNHHYQIKSNQKKNQKLSHQKTQKYKQNSLQKQILKNRRTHQNVEQTLQNSRGINQKSREKVDLKKMMLFKIQQELNHANSSKKNSKHNSNQFQSPKEDYQYSYHKANLQNYNDEKGYTNQNNSFEQQEQRKEQHGQLNGTKNVYEKWKTKERIKNQKSSKNHHHNTTYQNQQNFQSLNIVNTTQNNEYQRDEDWFYKKGLYFQQQKQKNNEKLFNQIYPFTTLKNGKISQNKKTNLHDRLFKDKQKNIKQMRMVENHVHNNEPLRPNRNKFWNSQVNVNTIKGLSPSMKKKLVQKNLQIKERVKQKDQEIDVALDQMIKEGLIKNHYSIKKVSLSPFRRTILK